MKSGFVSPRRCLKITVIYMCISPFRADNLLESEFLHKYNFCVTLVIFPTELLPSVPYVLVTETSSRSIGLEDVCDTCCRRFTSKQTFAARHKNVLAQRPCQHLAETLK